MAGEAGSEGLESLRCRLAGLAQMLGGKPGVTGATSTSPRYKPRGPAAAAAAPPPPPVAHPTPGHFQATMRPTVLRAANTHARDAPLGGLLQKYKDAEACWLKEKGRLVLEAKAEHQRRLKAEAELRRVQEQLAYRKGEVQHLKGALRGRDGQITELQDRLREYELEKGGECTAQATVRQAEAERDDLRDAMQEQLGRLDAANHLIAQANECVAAAEARAAAAAGEQQQAEAEAAAARAEADAQHQAAVDLQFKCGLLQQLADLTLAQNEEKTATLAALLNSESMLDAAEQGSGGEDSFAAGGQ